MSLNGPDPPGIFPLLVNGSVIGDLYFLLPGTGGRNGYIRIDATQGSVINSIQIADTLGTGYALDHFAYDQPTPEPASWLMVLAALPLFPIARRFLR